MKFLQNYLQLLELLRAPVSSSMIHAIGSCHTEIFLSGPQDANMSDMDYDSFSQVTLPKVQGSLNLDRLFQGHSLDFFIFFSSISSIIGIPGQSAYAAAKMFMTALAEGRMQRGLAASVLNIGAVLGAGYISKMSLDTSTTKMAMGLHPYQ